LKEVNEGLKHEYHDGPRVGENFEKLARAVPQASKVAVTKKQLIDRYVDEQAFRYNNRVTKDNPLTDADRFALAVSQIAGKRLTYKELTGNPI
jgi:hypothetical protein